MIAQEGKVYRLDFSFLIILYNYLLEIILLLVNKTVVNLTNFYTLRKLNKVF